MHALLKISDTHHGDLPPGLVIVLPLAKLQQAPKVGEVVDFENPKGGWSFGKLIAFTTPDQDEALNVAAL